MGSIFLLIFLLCDSVLTYNILAVLPHNGKSHFYFFQPLLKGLAKKGHNVTVLSHFPQMDVSPNYRDISLMNPKLFHSTKLEIDINDISDFSELMNLLHAGQKMCESGLTAPSVTEFLKENNYFDLVLVEYFLSSCYLGFAHKYKAPLIGLSSTIMLPWQSEDMGNPSNPAYVPCVSIAASDKMSFLQKVESTVISFGGSYIYRRYISDNNQPIAEKVFGKDLPSLLDISKNTSLLFLNTYISTSTPKPLVPGIIEIGGIHIQDLQKLPKHIDKWINESTHGVIYFSLGSMIKGHTFPEEKRQMFVNAFSRFPERVLWKWETNTMPGKPDNIMIEKWMPQLEILCHPNVKAFIAHGGLLGITEAVHCGVPLIIIPQFGDQFTNAKAIEANGGGVILDYGSLDEESIYNAIKTVLDPRFNQQAKELSARFRDRPLPPLETAIYWVEYVARHKGAPHLRTAAVGMPLYQYLLLDVLAFLTVILLSILFIFYLVIRTIYRKLFRSKEKIKQN